MESLAFLAFLIPLAGIGVVVLFVMAVVQQKQEHTGGFKQAFFTIVSLAMLAITIGSVIALMTTVAREYAFPKSVSMIQRYNFPPSLYLPGTGDKAAPEAYACESSCEFTADDRAQVVAWKQSYESWKTAAPAQSSDFKRNLVGPLSFLIVGLPLYLVFMRLMERGAKIELAQLKKPTGLRQLYYYFVAFSGLLMAVFAAGALINTGLRTVLDVDPVAIEAAPTVIADDQGRGPQSIINCAEACGFSEADVQLAKDWQSDYRDYRNAIEEPSGQLQDDLSTMLPVLLVGTPLFWLHFARIRKEAQGAPASPSDATPTPST